MVLINDKPIAIGYCWLGPFFHLAIPFSMAAVNIKYNDGGDCPVGWLQTDMVVALTHLGRLANEPPLLQVMASSVSPNNLLFARHGAVVAHIALVHNDGRLQPLLFLNAGLTVQDLERLAATFNARLATNTSSFSNAEAAEDAPPKPPVTAARQSPGSPESPEAFENDVRVPAIVDLNTSAFLDGGCNLPFFQSSWLRTICRTPALLALIPGLVSRRVQVATSDDEMHLMIEPTRGMRPMHGILWALSVYVGMFCLWITLIIILVFYLLSLPDSQQDPNKHLNLLVAMSAIVRSTAFAVYILGLHVLGAPRLVSISIKRDQWQATTALRMFLGRQVWRKSVCGNTSDLAGCQVCLSPPTVLERM
jgi:hypothetical protein